MGDQHTEDYEMTPSATNRGLLFMDKATRWTESLTEVSDMMVGDLENQDCGNGCERT
jgi:hypothetical protein